MGTGQLGQESETRPLRVRAFFGLPIPDGHRERLGSYIQAQGVLASKFRWTPAENLHVTIRFLGHLELEVADRIAGRVDASAPRAFTMQLGELGAFKRGRLARVLWIGLSLGQTEASAIAATVEAECVRAGLEAESRPYAAHMTIARARRPEGAPLPAEVPPALSPWRAGELILYRSHLGRGGPTYEPVRTISLR